MSTLEAQKQPIDMHKHRLHVLVEWKTSIFCLGFREPSIQKT
jgi:hypothetical protein